MVEDAKEEGKRQLNLERERMEADMRALQEDAKRRKKAEYEMMMARQTEAIQEKMRERNKNR